MTREGYFPVKTFTFHSFRLRESPEKKKKKPIRSVRVCFIQLSPARTRARKLERPRVVEWGKLSLPWSCINVVALTCIYTRCTTREKVNSPKLPNDDAPLKRKFIKHAVKTHTTPCQGGNTIFVFPLPPRRRGETLSQDDTCFRVRLFRASNALSYKIPLPCSRCLHQYLIETLSVYLYARSFRAKKFVPILSAECLPSR